MGYDESQDCGPPTIKEILRRRGQTAALNYISKFGNTGFKLDECSAFGIEFNKVIQWADYNSPY
jgi:hypothetical protein